MEQEGSGADYFTFYTGGCYTIPAAGTELTVVKTCNVGGLSYSNLGAGEKGPVDSDPVGERRCRQSLCGRDCQN